MNRLQQRRQRHKRRQEAINNLRKAGKFAATIVLLWFMWQLPATKAYFYDREETQATFRAATFADILAISPGKSKTNNSPGNPGPAFNVAQTVAGQIYLDFGTYPAGNNRNFPHVLTVKNTGERTLRLRWHFSGPLAQFFESQDQNIILGPGAENKLGFKLDTDPADTPGEHLGTLQLSALNGFITAELPARLRLAAKKSGKGQKATVNTEVYNDPGTVVSEAVYQAPDSSYPVQEHIGANGLPGVSESVYQGSGGGEVFGSGDSPGVSENVYQGPDHIANKDDKDGHPGGPAPEKAAGQGGAVYSDPPSEKGVEN
jgi:hypothetical protein